MMESVEKFIKVVANLSEDELTMADVKDALPKGTLTVRDLREIARLLTLH